MMMSMTIQPHFTGSLKFSTFPNQKLALKPFKASVSVHRKFTSAIFESNTRLSARELIVSASSAAGAIAEDASTENTATDYPQEKEKLGVVVKPMEKLRLVLKFIWMEKNIGLALDQAIPGHGTIPLSPYYFWPRKDAWEELKVLLESKPWISQKQMIILLNQATDIINLWQQSGGNLS